MMEPKRTESVGFAHVLSAEWTIFRKSRILVIGIVVAVLLTVLIGLYAANNGSYVNVSCGSTVCSRSGRTTGQQLVGPDGEAVQEKFYFVYQKLPGNGSITARLTSLTGEIATFLPNRVVLVPGVQPWAKAGVLIEASTIQGSPYAAMMLTGSHGGRMQVNFTQDIAGLPGSVSAASPRWLRLTREGSTLTGYESTNGMQWSTVGVTHLAGLSTTVQVGIFVTSPCHIEENESGGCGYAPATAVFDHVSLQGAALHGMWSRDDVGVDIDPDGTLIHPGSLIESGGTFTVTGNGDIIPMGDPDGTIEGPLIGAVIGLCVVILVAVLFATAEDRAGRIRISRRARPEWRVLVAKALVLALITFATQLVAVVIAAQLGKRIMLANGGFQAVNLLTELRVMVGTAAVVAVAAIFALALGALLRRRIIAVIAGLALTIVPFILAFVKLVPEAVAQWMLRLTPAAGFAIQQAIPAYPQVAGVYTLQAGYYPLTPWAGFAVLCGYAVLALGLAVFVPHHKDG